jgi:hypothetical protein
MKKRIWFTFLVIMFSSAMDLWGQAVPRATITGTVVDDSTSTPLQNVDVFIAHTTLGSGTDQNGRFTIPNIPTGSYEIVASRVGYLFETRRMTVSDSGIKEISIRLKPSAVQVREVVVTALDDDQWRAQIRKFIPLFLGKSANASGCTILNPEVLDFESGEDGLFVATARAPLEIDNPSLGYHIRFILAQFRVGGLDARHAVVRQFSRSQDMLVMEGFPQYTEMKPRGAEDTLKWRKNRQKAFLGSLRHFLSSLFKREANKNGFALFVEPLISQKEWEPLRRGVTEDDIVFDSPQPQERVLKFNRYLEIEYTRARLEPEYDLLEKAGTDNQVSWLTLNREAVTINSRGLISEWFPTISYGYWAWQRMADALPLDYDPEQE